MEKISINENEKLIVEVTSRSVQFKKTELKTVIFEKSENIDSIDDFPLHLDKGINLNFEKDGRFHSHVKVSSVLKPKFSNGDIIIKDGMFGFHFGIFNKYIGNNILFHMYFAHYNTVNIFGKDTPSYDMRYNYISDDEPIDYEIIKSYDYDPKGLRNIALSVLKKGLKEDGKVWKDGKILDIEEDINIGDRVIGFNTNLLNYQIYVGILNDIQDVNSKVQYIVDNNVFENIKKFHSMNQIESFKTKYIIDYYLPDFL